MVREKTISEQLDENNKLLRDVLTSDRLPGEKRFRFKKPSKGKMKKGYVVYVVMKNNNSWDFRKLPIRGDNVYLKDNKTFHIADADVIGMYKKWPVIVQPEWSNEPLTKETLTRKVEENKSTIKPQKQIIHLMEDARLAEEFKQKKSSKGLLMIGGLILVVYLIGSQLGWFGG